ncbi:MAG: alpha/beta hydrolase [Burkholderiales bacterium]|nr:MAG: alpha/beta hydrolase [Burkholderiales bacterium]
MHNAQHWYEFGPMSAPGIVRLALEWRAPWEFGAAFWAQPLLARAPSGDGHPVIVYPGLLAGDRSTGVLRSFLGRLGYQVFPSGLKRNLGPRDGVLDALRGRLSAVRREQGRKVSLIGWSLGGVYARELAKEFSDDTRLVITMGTPFTGHPKATNAWRVYEFFTGHRIGTPELHEPLRAPPPVPTTSIFSRTDGVVSWKCSVEKEGPGTENIEVEASHLGMGFNPMTLYAVADRLAQPEGAWKPFDRGGVRGWLYRDPRRRTWY